jgi:hypothetical protein
LLPKAGSTASIIGQWHLGLGSGTNAIDWHQIAKKIVSRVFPGQRARV